MSKNTGAYKTIDDRVANEIKKLHEQHTKLGSKGLLNVLKQSGTKINPKELDRFINEQGLKPSAKKKGAWRPLGVQAPWDR